MLNHAATLPEKIAAAVAFLQTKTKHVPQAGLILGSGLGSMAQKLAVEVEINFSEIPYFTVPTVDGHAGNWLMGKLSGKNVVVLQGRLHYYEGHSMDDVAFPIRVLRALGASQLLITNICGAVNLNYKMGDFVAIADHINLLGTNPLIGRNFESVGPRFPDMSEPYDRVYLQKLMAIATEQNVKLHQGVYACLSGPCLETAAEYRMLKIIGADTIGMSTVPEVIAAVHCGLKVAAVSLITDVCDPNHLKRINIPEIMQVAAVAEPKLAALVIALLGVI